jgi:hypothetical protein
MYGVFEYNLEELVWYREASPCFEKVQLGFELLDLPWPTLQILDHLAEFF